MEMGDVAEQKVLAVTIQNIKTYSENRVSNVRVIITPATQDEDFENDFVCNSTDWAKLTDGQGSVYKDFNVNISNYEISLQYVSQDTYSYFYQYDGTIDITEIGLELYEPIGWETPTKIKDAYATLHDGRKVPVTMPEYSGKTPVNKTNLEKMDRAIAYLYEHGTFNGTTSPQENSNSLKIKQLESASKVQDTKITELEVEVEECRKNMLTNEVEGTSIHIEDSANARIISLESEGNCEQVSTSIGNGDEYDSPSPDYPQDVEVIEAYNLFDKDNMNIINGVPTNGTIVASSYPNTFYIEVEPNQIYTVSREVVGTRFAVATTKEVPVVGSKISDSIVNNLGPSITVTTSSEAKYLLVYYLYNNTEDEEKILDSIQIVKGVEVKPYTPYGCIRKKIVGKNRLDTSKFVSKTGNGMTGSRNSDHSIKFTGTTTALSNFWINNLNEVLKAGTYKFVTNIDLTNKGTYSLLDNTSGSNVTINSCKKTSTFTLNKDMILTTAMIQINNDVTLNNDFYIMLVRENDSEEYELYQENNLDVNLQNNFIGKIGDMADTLRVENGRAILTKKIGKIVLNGIESWSYVSEKKGAVLSNYIKVGSPCAYSTHYICDNTWTTWTGDNKFGFNSDSVLWLQFGDIFTTVDEFQAWLSNNPVAIYYVLKEPYEVDLGEVTMPKTFKGVTNINMIANLESNMKLKYVRSTNIVVDNLAKAIVALGGEV